MTHQFLQCNLSCGDWYLINGQATFTESIPLVRWWSDTQNFVLILAHGTLNLHDLDNLHQFSRPLEVIELRASHLSLQQLTKIAGTNSF